MARSELDFHFGKISELISEINSNVPVQDAYGALQFRADLAGLLVVAMAATYETCVKEVICAHATATHGAFGDFASRNYGRLNSRIQVNDLCNYCALFDPRIKSRFKDNLRSRKSKLLDRTGKDIEVAYRQILEWRHDFAHAWNRNTTIEEAASTHRVAIRVLYAFDEAFAVV